MIPLPNGTPAQHGVENPKGMTGSRSFSSFVLLACLTTLATSRASESAAPARATGIEIVSKLEKPTPARPPGEKDFAGYLLVYFKDQTHSAYFAVSRDGYTFTDVNGGQPVF